MYAIAIALLLLVGALPARALACAGAAAPACAQLQQHVAIASAYTPDHAASVRAWLATPVARATGAQLVRAARSATARGYAQLMAGAVGEGIQTLLRAAETARAPTALDGAYLGVLVLWPELTPTQQADWARDLAGRYVLIAIGERASSAAPRPARVRAIDLHRLVWLYTQAREPRAVQHFATLGHHWFPADHLFARHATPPQRASAERLPPRSLYKPSDGLDR